MSARENLIEYLRATGTALTGKTPEELVDAVLAEAADNIRAEAEKIRIFRSLAARYFGMLTAADLTDPDKECNISQERFSGMREDTQKRIADFHMKRMCNPKGCPLCWRENHCTDCKREIGEDERKWQWGSEGVPTMTLCKECNDLV